MSSNELFWAAAREFKKTPQYQWAEDNGVELQWAEDNNIMAWHKQVVFYADISEKQCVDYNLRFLDLEHNQ